MISYILEIYKGAHCIMHLPPRWFLVLALIYALTGVPVSAEHMYISEPAANMTETSLESGMIGTLVGTLELDPSLPVSRITINPSIAPNNNSRNVLMYYTNANNLLDSESLYGVLYLTYYKTNGALKQKKLTSETSYTFTSLDASKPIRFYILVNTNKYTNFLDNTVRGWWLWGPDNRFVAMGAQPAFTLLSPSNTTYPVLSNQGETTLPIPFVGGGLPGPAGNCTISIGDVGVSPSSWLAYYNVSDAPVYSIFFANENVYIDDITQAVLSPVPLTNVTLNVENYQNTYLGQSRVNVRFYQAGYPSFRFLHENYPTAQLPYTLWVNQTEIPYNIPCSLWPAPMQASNSKLISLKVEQQDLDAAMEGNYATTITVEIISGI